MYYHFISELDIAMALSGSYNLISSSSSSSPSLLETLNPISKLATQVNNNVLCFETTKESIKQMFDKIELSVSSYDTAWVAMVPSPESPQVPCFPQCVTWLLDNQLNDGSWGLPNRPSWLVKDAVSCTLACVLALKRWGIGEEQMNNGIQFLKSNFTTVTDEKQQAPIGFDIIFPGMIECAKDLNLNLPLNSGHIDALLQKRHSELRRSNLKGRKEYLAYVSEGIGKLQDWEMVIKYQRKNGSLFNSPSTTAAALIHLQNDGCLHYLRSILEKFVNAVPATYPLDIYVHLFMVECLQNLGIDRHFRTEISRVLEETYKCWLRGEEEIFLDPATCAMAFRLLRVNGCDVSSDTLNQFAEKDQFFSSLNGYTKDIGAILELYKASQIIYPDESVLEKQYLWTSHFLKQELSNCSIHSDKPGQSDSRQEVEDVLNFPCHADMERLAQRRYINHYNVDNIRILKTSYRSSNIGNEYFQNLAVHDFNICQTIFREEFESIDRWVVENGLDKLKFARQKQAYCYFSVAANVFSPELSDARMIWAKSTILATVIDDFFDYGGSYEELENLVQLFEKWDALDGINFSSEEVEILFSALRSTICDIGDKAFKWQQRDVTNHIVEIWLNLLKSELMEANWFRNKYVPEIDEYMRNAIVSMALGPPVFSTLYFLEPKLSEEVVRSPEMHNLYKITSICGRLLNDCQTVQKESEERKLNAVLLEIIHSKGVMTEEEAIKKIKGVIDNTRTELRKLVLQEKGSIVPKACRDIFWKTNKVSELTYRNGDGFTTDMLKDAIKQVIYKPIFVNK